MPWKKPPPSYVKIHVDGAWKESEKCGGVGVVIRDELGMCVAASSKAFPFVVSPLHAKALAAREGLLLAT